MAWKGWTTTNVSLYTDGNITLNQTSKRQIQNKRHISYEINTQLSRKCQKTAGDIGKNRSLAWASIGSFLSLIITYNSYCRSTQYKTYLNPLLLFSISFVCFGFKAFPTIFLVFTYTLHVLFIVITPEYKIFNHRSLKCFTLQTMQHLANQQDEVIDNFNEQSI